MNYYTSVLKKYATFEGRASRKEYWMFQLFNFVISLVISLLGRMIFGEHGMGSMISGLYSLVVFIPCLALLVRRLHDTNRSAWWILIILIPLVGIIWLFVLTVLDGTLGDNQYGPNPKNQITPTI